MTSKGDLRILWFVVACVAMMILALALYACTPTLMSVPNCPVCPAIETPAAAPKVELPDFPVLPKVAHEDWCGAENVDCDPVPNGLNPVLTCYDEKNFALLQQRASLVLCDDCALRERAKAAGHQGALPAECAAHPECR